MRELGSERPKPRMMTDEVSIYYNRKHLCSCSFACFSKTVRENNKQSCGLPIDRQAHQGDNNIRG